MIGAGVNALNIRADSTASKVMRREDFFPFADMIGGANSMSGINVTPSTALTLSSYLACIRNASEDIGKMPIDIERETGPRTWKLDKKHIAHRLFNIAPNDEMTPMSMKEAANGNAMGGGVGLCVIERDTVLGPPVALWPIHPSRVRQRHDSTGLVFDVTVHDLFDDLPSAIRSKVAKNHVVRYPDRDVLNIHGFGAVGTTGYRMTALAQESIAMGLASHRYAARYYGNDATPSTIVLYPDKMNKETAKRIHAEFVEGLGGDNRHKIGRFYEGIKVQQLQVNPQDAQMIEAGNYTIEDMARWFRMPPHKIQHLLRSTFNNIDAQNIEYVIDCLDSWATRWEQEILRKLFTATEQLIYRVEFNFGKLLRGDPVKRAQINRIHWNMGATRADDVRHEGGKNPTEDGSGSKYYIPKNMRDASKPELESSNPGPGTGFENTETQRKEGAEPENPNDDAAKQNALDDGRAAMVDAIDKVSLVENRAAERAAKRHVKDGTKFDAWAVGYFPGRQDHYVEALTPLVTDIARTLGKDSLDAELILADAAEDHCKLRMTDPLADVLAEDETMAIIESIQELENV